MTTSEPVVNSLLNRATDARARLRTLDAERELLIKDILALDHVAQMYGTSVPAQEGDTVLGSLTLGQGLIHIANENDGILIVVEAKRRLLLSGVGSRAALSHRAAPAQGGCRSPCRGGPGLVEAVRDPLPAGPLQEGRLRPGAHSAGSRRAGAA